MRAWEQSLAEAGCSLDALEPLQLLHKRNGELLFALVRALGRDGEGKPLMPYALVRGPACVVMPVCRRRGGGGKKFLMIRQRRIGHGGVSLEFPAGMLDENLNDPTGVAVRELEEETGVSIAREALTPLWGRALYSSPGLADESIYLYCAELELDESQWQSLEGGQAGHPDEGEFITTTLKTFSEAAAEITSVQPLLAFLLYFRRFGESA